MKISEGTKISELIGFNPQSIEAIASINHHFLKLRNPFLRKMLAPRVTIGDAARIGGCSIKVFFEKLVPLGFIADLPDNNKPDIEVSSEFKISEEKISHRLDVREDLSKGRDPFLLIIKTANALKPGKCLLLINSFEPVPLIRILDKKGFQCFTVHTGLVVETYILKQDNSALLEPEDKQHDGFDDTAIEFGNSIKQIDVSKMEMPGPMVTILKELENLPEECALYVNHRKIPQFLLPELEQKGFQIKIKRVNDNEVKLLICKNGPGSK